MAMSTISEPGAVVTVRRNQRAGVLAGIAHVVDYAFSVLYLLLLVRLVLEFLQARRASGFFQLIAAVTDPFYAPFKSIVATRTVEGAPLVLPLVVAIVGYLLLHALIRGLLHLFAHDDSAIVDGNRV